MTLRLADIDQPSRPMVELSSGREVQLSWINGVVVSLAAEYDKTENPALLWQIARELLRTATDAEIQSLTVAECGALLMLASGHKVAEKPVADSPAPKRKRRPRAENQTGTDAT